MDNDLTIKQAREAAAHPPGPRPPARAAGAVPRVILGDWLCWVLSGMWGGREWWDPPAAAGRVRGEGSAEMRPGARKAAGGDGYPSRMNWGGWGALWGARGGGGGLFSCFDCRLTRIRSRSLGKTCAAQWSHATGSVCFRCTWCHMSTVPHRARKHARW